MKFLLPVWRAFLDGQVVHLPGPPPPPEPLSLYEVHRAQGLPPIGPYTTTLAGETVIPHGYCPNRGPERQAHIIPAGTSRCSECGADFKVSWNPRDERRKTQPIRADGLPEPVPPPVPLSVRVGGFALFCLAGPAVAFLTAQGLLRWRSEAPRPDSGYYAGAALRAALNRAPGALVAATVGWLVLLVGIAWGIYALT